MKANFLFLLFIIGACSSPQQNQESESKKIITAGGTVTEIVNELGFGASIIATDITSTFPESMKSLPSIGYRNQIKTEGILSLSPDMILAEEDYLSPDVVAQLKSTGVEIRFFEKPTTVDGTIQLITELSTYLDAKEQGESIISKLKSDLDQLETYLAQNQADKPSMLFIMARGEDMIFVGGDETFAPSIISLSGLESPLLGFKDFIPLTPEALTKFNPDYILLFDSGLASLGGKEGLRKIRGIEQTTAFQKDQILAYDGLLLSGFGPRVAEIALEIAKAVYQK